MSTNHSPVFPPPVVPRTGQILFSFTQFWGFHKASAINPLSKDTIRLVDKEEHAALFKFTSVNPEENLYAIQCVDRSASNNKEEGSYLCWDTNRFEFRDSVGAWEQFTVLPMNEHGHEYFVLKCHKGFLDADGKSGFRATPNGVRCYIIPK